MTQFAVIGNIAAHSGRIEEFDPADLWPDGGLTWQHLCGSHGTILGTYASRPEADKKLEEYLADCPGKSGGYCYTHNPTAE